MVAPKKEAYKVAKISLIRSKEDLEEKLDENGISYKYEERLEELYEVIKSGSQRYIREQLGRDIKGEEYLSIYISGEDYDDKVLKAGYKNLISEERYSILGEDYRNYQYLRDNLYLDDVVMRGGKLLGISEDNELIIIHNESIVRKNIEPYIREMSEGLKAMEDKGTIEDKGLQDIGSYIKENSNYDKDKDYKDYRRLNRLKTRLGSNFKSGGIKYKYIKSYDRGGYEYQDILIHIGGYGYILIGVYGVIKVTKEGKVEKEIFKRGSIGTTLRDWKTQGVGLLVRELINSKKVEKQDAILVGKIIQSSYDLRTN